MAERPSGYGFTAEISNKIQGKYDVAMEQEALKWIAKLVPEAKMQGVTGSTQVHEKLKDGIILCKLIEKLQPNSIKNINTNKMAFKQMENISNFLAAAEKFGVSRTDSFQTVDLYEATNMAQVIVMLHALGRKASSKGLNGIGPKEASENKRQFSEEQLRAGDGHIGLQMGTNKHANQSGLNFGKTRSIID
ncbi:myophilin [Hydra vulgaris]|uniref:Calponin n=1 Tax=Hydra vulgaris TaxID=6087 RepID=A0ABM4BH28_HYDVU